MTIKRDRDTGNMVAECDVCHDTVEFEDGEDFLTVRIAIHNDRWQTVRAGNGWINICPDCEL